MSMASLFQSSSEKRCENIICDILKLNATKA